MCLKHECSNMKFSFTKLYIILSWLPLTLYFLASSYISRAEGWGAWANGRILIYPTIISVILGLIGIVLIVAALKTNNLSSNLVFATLLSGSIGFWFLGLAIIDEIQRSFY